MNKKLVVLFFFLVLTFSLFAQSVYWEEDFDPAPADWTLDQNWSFSNGSLRLYWSPSVTNYDLSAISPEITLPQNVGDLIVTQYIDAYSPVDEIMSIGVNIDGNYEELWEYELTNGNWGTNTGEDVVIPLSDYSDQTVKIQFRSYGSSTYNFNWWDVFHVRITALLNNDLAALEVYGPPIAEQNQTDVWKLYVKNVGMNDQTSYTVKLFKADGTELGSYQNPDPLASLETEVFNFFWTPGQVETTQLYGEVILAGDENSNNDMTEYLDVSIHPEGERQYLIWDNDNNSDYLDPESGAFFQCEDGLENALASNNIDFTVTQDLPTVLRNYEVVFIELGLYCVG